MGHRPPGLPAQAPHRPVCAVRDASPAGRDRWLPAAQRVGARRVRRRPRGDGPLDRGRPRDRPRRPARHGADRGGRRRRGPHERPLAGGAERPRPPAHAGPHHPERQRDVHQPLGGGALEVPVRHQALHRLAAVEARLRPAGGAGPDGRSDGPGAQPPRAQVGGQLRPARPALRGSGHHLHRRGSRPRPTGARAHLPWCPRHGRPGPRARPDPEGARLPSGGEGPGQLPRRRAAADGRHP